MKSEAWWAENWDNHDLIKAELKNCAATIVETPLEVSRLDVAGEIKRIHAIGGRHLTVAEVVEFINTPIKLGKPPNRRRGRPSIKDPYRLAFERRRGLYQRFVRLPAGVRRDTGKHIIDLIQRLFDRVEKDGVPERKRVSRVSELLTAMRIQPPDMSYLYKIKKRLIKAG